MITSEIDGSLESLAPYFSNYKRMKSFLEEHEGLDKNELTKMLEDLISESTGPLRTDYKILLNKLSEEKR